MVLLYIRHGKDGEDRYDNDSKLEDWVKREIKQKTKEWIKTYGLPDVIYFGPFHRTYQTAKYIYRVVRKYRKIRYQSEPKIGRYVGNGTHIRSGTRERGAIMKQSMSEFKEGINEHYEKIKEEGGNIWNVTHAYVMTRTAKYLDIPYKSHVEYLDVLPIQP